MRHLIHGTFDSPLFNANSSLWHRTNIAESQLEILLESLNVRILLLELVNTHSVRNRLNQATCWAGRNNVERLKPEFELMRLKNRLKLGNELRCELFLRQVVGRFNDD